MVLLSESFSWNLKFIWIFSIYLLLSSLQFLVYWFFMWCWPVEVFPDIITYQILHLYIYFLCLIANFNPFQSRGHKFTIFEFSMTPPLSWLLTQGFLFFILWYQAPTEFHRKIINCRINKPIKLKHYIIKIPIHFSYIMIKNAFWNWINIYWMFFNPF